MVDQAGTLDTLYRHWLAAEARYADALAAFSSVDPPADVLKDSALELARVRNQADSARDKFFRKALMQPRAPAGRRLSEPLDRDAQPPRVRTSCRR